MVKNRTRRSAQQWQLLVQKHQDSGLSAPEFCRAESVGYQSFMKWQKRLNSANSPADFPETPFIELTPPAGTRDTAAGNFPDMPSASLSPVNIELSLGNGIELRITRQL